MKTRGGSLGLRNDVLVRLALVAAALLLVPLVVMQFTDEVAWTLPDFLVMGALLFGTGVCLVWSAQKVPRHRAVVGATILTAFLFIWAELAVGVFTNLGS